MTDDSNVLALADRVEAVSRSLRERIETYSGIPQDVAPSSTAKEPARGDTVSSVSDALNRTVTNLEYAAKATEELFSRLG